MNRELLARAKTLAGGYDVAALLTTLSGAASQSPRTSSTTTTTTAAADRATNAALRTRTKLRASSALSSGGAVRNSAAAAVLARAWRAYLGKLSSEPVVTKALTAAVISALSDVGAAQCAGGAKTSARSVINQFCIGLVIRGPVVHWFHTLLDRVVFARAADQTRPAVVLGKVLIDQFLFAPPFTALYFYVIGLMEEQPLRAITRKVRAELLDVLKSNWAVWIPANLVGYYAVPLELRVLWGNVIGIIWTAILITKVKRSGGGNGGDGSNGGRAAADGGDDGGGGGGEEEQPAAQSGKQPSSSSSRRSTDGHRSSRASK